MIKKISFIIVVIVLLWGAGNTALAQEENVIDQENSLEVEMKPVVYSPGDELEFYGVVRLHEDPVKDVRVSFQLFNEIGESVGFLDPSISLDENGQFITKRNTYHYWDEDNDEWIPTDLSTLEEGDYIIKISINGYDSQNIWTEFVAKSINLTVSKSKIEEIRIECDKTTIVEEEMLQLNLIGKVDDQIVPEYHFQGVEWSSSTQAVVTINDEGLVKGEAEGRAIITAKLDGITNTITITVVNNNDYILDFHLNKDEYKINEEIEVTGSLKHGTEPVSGEEVIVGINHIDAVYEDTTWTYPKTDDKGEFRFKVRLSEKRPESQIGTYKIWAYGYYGQEMTYANGGQKTFDVLEGSSTLKSIEIIQPNSQLDVGQSLQLNLKGVLDSGLEAPADYLQEAVWTSSNETVASIDEKGVVVGKAEGTVKISVKVGSLVSEIELNVIHTIPSLRSIVILADVNEIEEGEFLQLDITGTMTDGTEADKEYLENNVIWSSLNATILTVDTNGIIEGKNSGISRIKAKVGDIEDVIDLEVKEKQINEPNAVIKFTLDKNIYKVEEYIIGTGTVELEWKGIQKEEVTLIVENESGKSIYVVEQYTTDENGRFNVKFKMPSQIANGEYELTLKSLNAIENDTITIEKDA